MSKTSDVRRRTMQAVKSVDTTPELAVRKILHGAGYRYRLHRAGLPGKPDIVFVRRQKVIFVHGCFWHGHDCSRGARKPKTNAAYWHQKIARNRARDSRVADQLRAQGWKVATVWECETKEVATLRKKLDRFLC